MSNTGKNKFQAAAQVQPTLGTPVSHVGHTASRTIELYDYFETLKQSLGPMGWWPGRTPFEVIIGAILTQNTAWTNVERAIANLRAAKMLTPAAIAAARTSRLANLIRSSGYFRQKALKLKAFVAFLEREYGGSLERMFSTPTAEL